MGNSNAKYIVSLFLLLTISCVCFSQQRINTSNSGIDKNEANDVFLLNKYAQLSFNYSEVNRDSSLYYGRKALESARRLNQKFYEAFLLTFIGFDLSATEDYSNALKALLQASKLAEDTDIGKDIIRTNYINQFIQNNDAETNRLLLLGYIKNSLGILYGNTGNIKKELSELLEARKLVNNRTKDMFLLSGINSNIASVYIDLNKLDSAIYYQKQVIENEKTLKIASYKGVTLTDIGILYLNKGNSDSAKRYLFNGLKIIIGENLNISALATTYIYLAELYETENKPDSSLYYARLGLLNYSRLGESVPELLGAYSALYSVFSEKKMYDSAFFYLNLAKNMSDSLSERKVSNLNKFQAIGFEEQLKLIDQEKERISKQNRNRIFALFLGLIVFSVIAYMLYRNNRYKQKANLVLESTLSNLKSTQSQLIQSEKMASLGELTAGIAHEIQNPLNFVNNFSEVSNELIDEMIEELAVGTEVSLQLAIEIADDIKQNLEKINHHGKRADAIVKGMLQHSRTNNGVKEPTDINALSDEYLRLAYHGLRAKDKSFNATLKTDYDENIGKINIIPQDIGKVILNMINNAFFAVDEKKKLKTMEEFVTTQVADSYEPTVSITIQRTNSAIELLITDNGNGIPRKALDKIFQPFFTTKPTGQGTGLGLSLSYDIVKAHGGEIMVNTTEGEGTTFTIRLPL